ncbi:sensor histidine kinase [Herbidospora mongoliensis]|uniref:sensor histidine kinase n=1 Tax=Herbidospora mongoliensis TaxID=688067 RepID=UPI000A532157|nr:histidine kinase [Herbidospora mongoliensis]
MTPNRQDTLMAVAAFAVGVVLLIAGAYDHKSGVPLQLFLIPLAITCVGVVIRRRRPVTALVIGVIALVADASIGPSLGTAVVFSDNVYAASLYGPRKLMTLLLRISPVWALAAGAATGLQTHDWGWGTVMAFQVGLITVMPVTTAAIVRNHRDNARQAAIMAEFDRKAAISAERTRMARELHDLVANHFSAIAIQSSAVLSRKDLDAKSVREIVESIRENSVQGMAEMRGMIGLLRAEGECEALRPSLSAVDDLVKRSGMTTTVDVLGAPRDLPPAVDLAAYRIVQESLTNALKHGSAPVSIAIDYRPDELALTINNPVTDRPRDLPGARAGLIGMHERATLLGGTFEAGPSERGWRVSAILST